MNDDPSAESREYVCASCQKRAPGRYLAGGWWQYPLAWFVHDNADRWACSAVCARALATGGGDEARRRSGERPKFDLDLAAGGPKKSAKGG